MIRNINTVVAAGSVDGVCTTAALLRVIGNSNVDVVFAQAFNVDKIDVAAWVQGRKIAFVDLAVNNRDMQMTRDFVARIRAAGHEIVAVCDEHSREDWLEVLGSFDGLIIQPQSQYKGVFGSSGKVLIEWALAQEQQNDYFGGVPGFQLADEQFRELCAAADAGDRMDFSTRFGGMVNAAVKSKIQDDTRRVYLARHFAEHAEADETIRGWIKEYEAILANHSEILAAKSNLGEGIVRASSVGKAVDMTTLMKSLHNDGARVVVLETEMFDKSVGGKIRLISFGTDKKIDLLGAIKMVVPTASGFAQKANVRPEDEPAAIAAVRALLAS